MNGLAGVAKNLGGVVSQNSPTILTGLGCAGVVTTAVLAVRATPKAMRLLEEERKHRHAEGCTWEEYKYISNRDTVRICWKEFLPAVGVGAASICCILSSNSISNRRIAAVAGLYGVAEATLKEYQRKVVETLGENKERRIRDEIASDRLKANPVSPSEVILGKGDILCYDSQSGRYFKSTVEDINQTINRLNKRLLSDDFIALNELYFELGMAPIKIGEDVGWKVEKGLIEIGFSTQLSEDQVPCLVLLYDVMPTPKFLI
jgi:hypothetical protein